MLIKNDVNNTKLLLRKKWMKVILSFQSEFIIEIFDLKEGLNYYTGQSFNIKYSSGLPDEKLYQYKFTLYKNNNIIQINI